MICHGLTALDDETLQFFADHPSLVSRLYERSAPAFAAFSGSIRIRGNRVVPAGAPRSARPRTAGSAGTRRVTALWEAVVGEKVTRPERFMLALFELERRPARVSVSTRRSRSIRRAARSCSGCGSSDPGQAPRTIQGAGDGRDRRVQGLAPARRCRTARASWDLAMALMRLEVTANGAPAPPASRAFWLACLASTDLSEDVSPQRRRRLEDDAVRRRVAGGNDRRARTSASACERLDQIAFAQRAIRARWRPRKRAAVLVALRALPHYRMLMLTLERMGVQAPAVYAAAARQAHRLSALRGQPRVRGAGAVSGRARAGRADGDRAHDRARDRRNSSIERLVAVPMTARRPIRRRHLALAARRSRPGHRGFRDGGDAASWRSSPQCPARRPGDDRPVRLTWEGQPYRLDLGFAERGACNASARSRRPCRSTCRFRSTRLARSSPPMHCPSTRSTQATDWRALTESAPNRPAADATRSAARRAGGRRRGSRRARDPAQDASTSSRESIGAETSSAHHGSPTRSSTSPTSCSRRRCCRSRTPLTSAIRTAGAARRRRVVPPRFRVRRQGRPMRVRAAWAMPRQEVTPGVPWHVSGSLLGLDIGLAPLALRRMNFEHLTGRRG